MLSTFVCVLSGLTDTRCVWELALLGLGCASRKALLSLEGATGKHEMCRRIYASLQWKAFSVAIMPLPMLPPLCCRPCFRASRTFFLLIFIASYLLPLCTESPNKQPSRASSYYTVPSMTKQFCYCASNSSLECNKQLKTKWKYRDCKANLTVKQSWL